MKIISIKTNSQCEFVNITRQIQSLLSKNGLQEGAVCLFNPHTTAGMTINEAADPDVSRDIIKELNKIVPFSDGYAHMEGNSAAHIKASLCGCSLCIPVTKGRLVLGTWQGIYFCEFDGPRQRQYHVQFLKTSD